MTEADELKAEAIIGQWFWQMSEGHNFRWKNAVKSMTLFYESAPMESDVAQLVLEYLRTRSAVTQLVIGHKKWMFDEPGWNTKDAWYQTAPSEQWAGTESKKVRVYWVLAQAGDGTADGPYTVEDGCKYLVTHSYYWDVAGEPQLPQSSSGVQYSIQGFTRDRETGLYSFIIEKRETLQQDIPLYESVKTLFEDVSEEQHLGVQQTDVGSTGLAASVGNGERVERHLSKNADCTTDITNRKVKDKKVEQARTVVRKELRGTSAATTDRNLTTAEVATKTAAAQEIGETRTVEKTDTDLRNLTVEKFTPAATPITIAESCEKETSVHTDTKVEAVDAANAGPVEQTAETNKRKTVSYRKNDDGKTADKTTVTQTWQEQTATATSNFATERATTVVKTNTTGGANAEMGNASAQPNDHGSKTTHVTEYTPIPKDSGWITWQSVEEGPTHTYTYECGIRVFKNLAAVPTPPGGSRVHISPNINRYGLYDGSIAYSKLISWVQGGGSGTEGGSQAGSFQFVYVSDYQTPSGSDGDLEITPVFATATISTRTYYGRGNEGSEAQAAANSPVLPGVHLPHRTYITSSTTSIVQAMKRAETKLQVALANRKARGT